ncbi:GTPase HflX [Lactobacillus sp. S2-2]|uniref:GTPase HflX n=1 Tax=Lactobacillus sp. S2-2 TaxID=2692917 RepID=UPI001EFFED50|nr:GTPase HflX [Lactobacillus sp. S2-2]MCF6514733.1 GTPase HflX [Lactobacillus sp. S2-2]
MNNNTEETKKVITIGLNLKNDHFDYSMEELNNLILANNMISEHTLYQKSDRPDSATYFGKGKVEELKEIAISNNIDTVVVNDELSPSQIRNLEKITTTKIIDRTGLILEIFANRAQTKEAKLQVQLAKLEYQLPRLHTSISQRLDQQSAGGGLANRGSGETKIELNRRNIQKSISQVRHELKEIEHAHKTQKQKRDKNEIKNVALVGYTNAGKSTIMNEMIKKFSGTDDKQVMVKDMLFATLDTSVRNIKLPDNKTFLLSDTVGFVSNLPHKLIEAFKSTLSEAASADLLVQVVDNSDENQLLMMETTETVLKEVGAENIPMVRVFNKTDLTDSPFPLREGNNLNICAKDNQSIDLLIDVIKENIFKDFVTKTYLIPFTEGQIESEINQKFNVLSQDFTNDGTLIKVELPESETQRYKNYEQV